MDSKERFDKEVQAVRMDSWLLLLDDAVRAYLARFSTDEKNRHLGDYEAFVDICEKIMSAFHNALWIYEPYDDQAAQESAIWSELEECWLLAWSVMGIAIEAGKKELSVTPDDIEEWGRWTDCRATPQNDKSVRLWFRFAAAENAVQRFGDWGSERPNNPKWLVCAPRKKDKEPAADDGAATVRAEELNRAGEPAAVGDGAADGWSYQPKREIIDWIESHNGTFRGWKPQARQELDTIQKRGTNGAQIDLKIACGIFYHAYESQFRAAGKSQKQVYEALRKSP